MNGLTKEELLNELHDLAAIDDIEAAHVFADEALLRYINDPEVREAYVAIDKWYA